MEIVEQREEIKEM